MAWSRNVASDEMDARPILLARPSGRIGIRCCGVEETGKVYATRPLRRSSDAKSPDRSEKNSSLNDQLKLNGITVSLNNDKSERDGRGLTAQNQVRRDVYPLPGLLSNHVPVFSELGYRIVGLYPVWYQTLTNPPSRVGRPKTCDGPVVVTGGD